ncbi:hypothetical protein C0992_009508 [Termitomyces sp. T32_za158]|nr:hypothetical protein C0992_009508 [Termitomyces sp. T32_za158]
MPFRFFGGPLLQYTKPSDGASGSPPDLALASPGRHRSDTNDINFNKPLQSASGQTLLPDAVVQWADCNRPAASDVNDAEDCSTVEQLISPGISDSRVVLAQKRRNSGSDNSSNCRAPDNDEVAADGSYCRRTKVRVIQDPALRLQNVQLSSQLNEERARVGALTVQLHRAQHEQVANAWMARGVYDQLSSQLRTAVEARNSEQDRARQSLESTEYRLSHDYEERLQQALNEREQRFQQELQEALQQECQNLSTQLEEAVQQRLQNLTRSREDVYQSEVRRMQEEHQQQAAESMRVQQDLEKRIQELEQIQAQESQELAQRHQQELEAQLQLQHQDLTTQTAAEIQQQLDQRDRSHEQSLRAQISRIREEHQQAISESTRTREQMQSKIQELEQARAQETDRAERAHASAEAAFRSEAAYESIWNHDAEMIAGLEAHVERLQVENSSLTSKLSRESARACQSSQGDNTAIPAQGILNSNASSGLSARAREKLPADPRLA